MLSKVSMASLPGACWKNVALARKRTDLPSASRSTIGSSSPFGWLATSNTGPEGGSQSAPSNVRRG
jgi:hypothetical protein